MVDRHGTAGSTETSCTLHLIVCEVESADVRSHLGDVLYHTVKSVLQGTVHLRSKKATRNEG